MAAKLIIASLIMGTLLTLSLVNYSSAVGSALDKYGEFPEGVEGFNRYCLLHDIIAEEWFKYIDQKVGRALGFDLNVLYHIIISHRTPKKYCSAECKNLVVKEYEFDDEIDAEIEKLTDGMVDEIKQKLDESLPVYSKCANALYARLEAGEEPSSDYYEY